MENYQNEVLALQEMNCEISKEEAEARSTPICTAVITAASAVTAATASAAWNSSLTLGCGK